MLCILDDAHEVARPIQAGSVANQAFDLNAPFSGSRRGGNGGEWSKFGFNEYVEITSALGHAPEKAAT